MGQTDLNAMMVAASERATASRWRETVDIATKVVTFAPSEYQAWWLLGQAYSQLGQATDSVNAYANYYQYAPKRSELRAMRSFAAEMAGIAFEEAGDDDEESDYPLVSFVATIDGEQAFIQARNDSGKALEEVVEAAESLVGSAHGFDAWRHVQAHPELLTSIADTVLSSLAQAQADVRRRTGIERYRDALRRVREDGRAAPFAEMVDLSEADFVAFIGGVNDLQPILFQLAGAPDDSEREAILARHPEVVSDDRTLVFLRVLGGLQPNADARETIQSLFTLIRHARKGTRPSVSAPSARVQDAEKHSTAALTERSVAAIDSALGEWDNIKSDDNGERAVIAVSRGALQFARHDLTSDAGDLDRACATFAEAIRADPEPDSPMLPYYYGMALLRRFERDGTVADLEKGIAAMRLVLTLVVDGTHVEGAARSQLGAMLMRRGQRTGNLADLNESIAAHRLAATADADRGRRASRLINLATACQERFEMSGSVADLDEAERTFEEALTLAPSHVDALGGIARLYRSRYRLTANTEWLDRAIEAYQAVLDAPGARLDHALALNNLSSALRDRYLELNDPADIDDAIMAAQQAVAGAPPGLVHRPLWLENLGRNLLVRTVRTGNADDRRAAIAAFEEALVLASEGQDVWRTAPANLGGLIESEDPDRGIELQELGFARMLASSNSTVVIQTARALGKAHGRRGNWLRAGEVLLAGIDALEQLQRTQLSTSAKKAWLAQGSDLHLVAAEALLKAGKVGDALVAIERGRGRLLAEVLDRDRAALTELGQLGDQRVVERYRTAAEQVRMLTAAADRGQDVREALPAARRSLESAVSEVRQATDGAAFSRPLTIDDIVRASELAKAPIVYLVPLSSFGVAITVSGTSLEIRTSALPDLTSDRVNDVVERYLTTYREFVGSGGDEVWQRWEATLDAAVQWCWDECMRSVVAELGEAHEAILLPIGRLGRLPLHAASGAGGSALDPMIWRYAPNARLLAQLVDPAAADSLLAVSYAAEEAPLPYASMEITATRRAFSSERVLEGQNATVTAALREARDATVLHFACHAKADGDDALVGGLALADGVLSLQALLDARVTNGTIAVLSACETGVIASDLPDEVVSIASGLLQAGASAVVSSLWEVPDMSTAVLMSRFYFLWRNERQRPAEALRAAQRWLRDSNNSAIAAFLRATATGDLVESVIDELESDESGSMFGHPIHWAGFIYSGR